MNTKKRALLFIGIAMLLILWIVFSNSIIAKLSSSTPLEAFDFNMVNSTSTGKYDIVTEYLGGFTDTFITSGWAYCESDDPQDGKPVLIIFRNPSNGYAATSTTVSTLEANAIFGYSTDRTYRFAHSLSLLSLPDGTYDLYLYCKENDRDTMLVNLQTRMKREGRTFSQTEESPLVKESRILLEQSNSVHMDITPTLEQSDGLLTSQGWILCENKSSLHQNVYICVHYDGKKDIYWAQSVSRQDVVDAFGNPDYLQSGFRFSIPAARYEDKTFSIETIVEIDGVYYTNGQPYEVTII